MEQGMPLPEAKLGSETAKLGKARTNFQQLLDRIEAEHDRQLASLGATKSNPNLSDAPTARLEGLQESTIHNLSMRISELTARLDGIAKTRGGECETWEASLWSATPATPRGQESKLETVHQRQRSTSAGSSHSPVRPGLEAPKPSAPPIWQSHRSDATPNPASHDTLPAIGEHRLRAGVLGPSVWPSEQEYQREIEAMVPQRRGGAAVEKVGSSRSYGARGKFGGRSAIDLSEVYCSGMSSEQSNMTIWERVVEFVEGEAVDLCVAMLIMLNTIIMAFEMQYQGIGTGFIIEHEAYSRSRDDAWPHAQTVFNVLEKVFTCIFTLEIVLKVCVLGRRYYLFLRNWIDIFIVGSGLLYWVVGDFGGNPTILRLLRLVKLSRGIRLFKNSAVLEHLSFLMKCLAACVSTLFWSVCLLCVIQCIAAMIMMQLVSTYLEDPSQDVDARHAVFDYYGTFSRSALTMFEILMANWAPSCRVLIDNVSEYFTLFFLIYRCIIGFAVLSVITAVFIQQTITMASQDVDIMLQRKRREKQDTRNKFEAIFRKIDKSQDGFLSFDEFMRVIRDPVLQMWMSALEIETHDVYGFFKILAGGDACPNITDFQISLDEFMQGASRLRGGAKRIDVAKLTYLAERIETKLDLITQTAAFPSRVPSVASPASPEG